MAGKAVSALLSGAWDVALELMSSSRVMRHVGDLAAQKVESGHPPEEKKKSWLFGGGITAAEERIFYLKIMQSLPEEEALVIAGFVEWMLQEAKRGGREGHEKFIHSRHFLVRIAKDFVDEEQACKAALSDLASKGLGTDGKGRNYQAMYRHAVQTRMMADSNKELLDYIAGQMDAPTAFPFTYLDKILVHVNSFLEIHAQWENKPKTVGGRLKALFTPWKL